MGAKMAFFTRGVSVPEWQLSAVLLNRQNKFDAQEDPESAAVFFLPDFGKCG